MKLPDGYEILGTLGSGAMGVVHRARQSGLQREVALKCIRAEEQPSPAFLERFRREALALSRVSHPNLVKLYDVGTDDDCPYIAMELIAGRPLEALLRDNPVEVRRRSQTLFRSILDAMVAVHDAGLAHRDLKPSNIMVTPDWRPVVMDLGLVKDLSGDGTSITNTGTLIGTPQYLAPEVIQGQTAGSAADVWALGCIYFAMNAGMAPFRAPTLADLYRVITTEPLPDLDATCPDLNASRRQFLLQLLERDPRFRPRTARSALEALRSSVGQSRPLMHLSKTASTRALGRRRAPLALAMLALVGALAFVWHARRPAPDLLASATPVGPAPVVPPVTAGPDPVADVHMREAFLERLGGRDRHPLNAVIKDILNVPGVPRPKPATGRTRGTEPTVLTPAARAPVLAAQRKLARNWLLSTCDVELDRLVEAVPRWLADATLPEETRYRIYRALASISSLDCAAEVSLGTPLLDVDALVAPYVRLERGTAPPAAGYHPLRALTQPPVVEMMRTSHLVVFDLIPAEAGLFPESWWDTAQTAVQVLEEPETRRTGLVWYDLGVLPRGTLTGGATAVSLRATDFDPGHRAWLRFGKRRTVYFRNTRALTFRGAQGVELPPRATLESKAVTLTATVPPGFLTADDHTLELGCDTIEMGTAYNNRYFWVVDVVLRGR